MDPLGGIEEKNKGKNEQDGEKKYLFFLFPSSVITRKYSLEIERAWDWMKPLLTVVSPGYNGPKSNRNPSITNFKIAVSSFY